MSNGFNCIEPWGQLNHSMIQTAYALRAFDVDARYVSGETFIPPFDAIPTQALENGIRWVADIIHIKPDQPQYLTIWHEVKTSELANVNGLFASAEHLGDSVAERLSAIREAYPALTIWVYRGEKGVWLLQERWFYRISAYPNPIKAYPDGAQDVCAAGYVAQASSGNTPARSLQWGAAAARLKLEVEDWRLIPNTRAVNVFLKHTAKPLPVQQAEWGSDLAKTWLAETP